MGTANLYNVLTNLALGDSALYGYNFTRWVIRLGYVGPGAHRNPHAGEPDVRHSHRRLQQYTGLSRHGRRRPSSLSNRAPDSTTYLNNPSLADLYNNPSWNNGTNTAVQPPSVNQYFPFILDGRWLHAFNGPGMTDQRRVRELPL